MNPFIQSSDDGRSYGIFANEKLYSFSYSIRYEELGFNPVTFLDWVVQYMTGIVMVDGTRFWFNDTANETTLLLAYDQKNQYNEPLLHKWHKHSRYGSFTRYDDEHHEEF